MDVRKISVGVQEYLQDHNTKEIYNPYAKDEKEGGRQLDDRKEGGGSHDKH
jgi:hypothetical protein